MKIEFDFSNQQSDEPIKGSMAEAGNYFYKAGRLYLIFGLLLILQLLFLGEMRAGAVIGIASFITFMAGSHYLVKGGECLKNYDDKV